MQCWNHVCWLVTCLLGWISLPASFYGKERQACYLIPDFLLCFYGALANSCSKSVLPIVLCSPLQPSVTSTSSTSFLFSSFVFVFKIFSALLCTILQFSLLLRMRILPKVISTTTTAKSSAYALNVASFEIFRCRI